MFTASPTEAWSEQSAAFVILNPKLSLDLRQNPLKITSTYCRGGAQFFTMVTHSGQQQHVHRGGFIIVLQKKSNFTHTVTEGLNCKRG